MSRTADLKDEKILEEERRRFVQCEVHENTLVYFSRVQCRQHKHSRMKEIKILLHYFRMSVTKCT